jgi:hypothetical protein
MTTQDHGSSTKALKAFLDEILISKAFAGIVKHMLRIGMTACCLGLRAEAAACATKL